METDEFDSSLGFPKMDALRTAEKRLRGMSDLTINEDIKDDELINMYKEAEMIEEQADILHYLFYNKQVF